MHLKGLVIAAGAAMTALLLGSCATVLSGTSQELTFITYPEGAQCAVSPLGDDRRHDKQMLRDAFKGAYLAMTAIATGHVDLIALDQAFLANPDLVERLWRNAPLNAPDTTTFYGGDRRCYTDYPRLEKVAA